LTVKINGNRGSQEEISVSTKVSKEIVPFQQEVLQRSNLCTYTRMTWFNLLQPSKSTLTLIDT